MIKNIFLGLALVLIVAGAGCKKSCSNCVFGTCDKGVCNCPDPYSGNNCDTMCSPGLEGYMCATPSRNKFLGTWNCTSTGPTGLKKSYLIVFSAYPGIPEWMYMSNFNSEGYVVPCTVTGKYQFQVQDSSTSGIAVFDSGDGVLANGTLTINLVENNSTYFATATLQ